MAFLMRPAAPRPGQLRGRAGAIGCFLAVWLLTSFAPGAALRAQPVAAEYQLKAVFLFNFTQFIEWPASAFATPDAPLVIGVLGTDPFGPYLDETVRGEKINGHPLEVRRYRTVADVGPCHLLFVSASEGARLKEILARLRGRSTVTVGDFENFANNGGVIRFLTDRSRITLRVNLAAAKAAGVTISSKLLRAAQIVDQAQE